MTVNHSQADVAFHVFPEGQEVLRLPVAAFGYHDDKLFIDWSGGFLYRDIAIVTIMGVTNDEEWRHHHRVNLRTASLLGRFEPKSDGCDFEPLGNGAWIFSKPDSNPVRLHDS